ncbi:hypothetical protein BCU70_06825 [Vibrio sp. 10N.286.49.C2]|uniref:hypothetical protein n=1 Tax=unclassified Vibrio TaxID=2614977 RepID=UPI000C84D615|nr:MULTISPECIES: hypothetical protein [unclassified Vibrio]PMH31599.1 hypothetical protein BCU70_06825 [Vibrio sp. 10N.286.49.C2]PMH50621.1 hypothetical protein BCU66_19185 [Vibrio sp. 10N.286.49.B1]PMH82809.1 hypothetical protein BCU58_16895 [Vibrio sp. 10N.286.48.B7]
MTFRILILSAMLILSGCASERYFGGNGLEALVYQQRHTVEMSIQDEKQAQQKLNALFSAVEGEDTGALYSIEYRNNAGKVLIDRIIDDYPALKVKKHKVTLAKNTQLLSDLKLQITFYALQTEECHAAQIGFEHSQTNCFSESARLKQVANKSRLLGGN